MVTFVEFYTTLLGFVNFRLYNTIGLVYPPRFDVQSDEQGGELGALTVEGKAIDAPGELEASSNGHLDPQSDGPPVNGGDLQKQVAMIEAIPDADVDEEQENRQDGESNEVNDAIDEFEVIGEGADVLPQPETSSNEAASLFGPFTFFLSRETPRAALEFILRAFGCKRVGWDAVLGDGAFTSNENDSAITHQVVDRPPPASDPEEAAIANDDSVLPNNQAAKPGYRIPGRTYIQPQWVWDCINEGKLLRPDLYAPGAIMPPHLSPFVKPSKNAYDPTAPLAEQEREGEAEEAEGLTDSEAENADQDITDPANITISEDPASPATNGMAINNDTSSSSDPESDARSSHSSFAGFDTPAAQASSDSEAEAETALTQHQRELEAEAAGLPFANLPTTESTNRKANGSPVKSILKAGTGEEARKRAARRRKAEEEELERRKGMMGRRKRKVLEKMMYSNKKRDEEAEGLRRKRRRIEKQGGM